MGCERSDTHRHDGAFRGGQRPHGPEELVRPGAVHDPQDGVTAGRQAERPLSSVLRLFLAFDQPSPHEPVNQAARRRWRPSDRFGQLANRQRAAISQNVQTGELREPESQLTELTGEADDELPPQRSTHGHAFADLADIG